jgi:hypothetical protein
VGEKREFETEKCAERCKALTSYFRREETTKSEFLSSILSFSLPYGGGIDGRGYLPHIVNSSLVD